MMFVSVCGLNYWFRFVCVCDCGACLYLCLLQGLIVCSLYGLCLLLLFRLGNLYVFV